MAPKVDLRNHPPVTEAVERPEKPRRSFLQNLDQCPRSAYLSLKNGGGLSSPAADAGTAFHDLAERAVRLMLETGEVQIPGEVARELMVTVLAERKDLVVPHDRHDSLRLMAWNFAEGCKINPKTLIGLETGISLKVGNWTVQGTIDRAHRTSSTRVDIYDYKTSLHVPSEEETQRNFQAAFYALLVAWGHFDVEEGEPERRVADGLSDVHIHFLYPRYTDGNGQLVERVASFTITDLIDFRRTVEGLLGKLEHGLETGEWPAMVGDHCVFCPSPAECPIPALYRPIESFSSPEEAEDAAGRYLLLDSEKTRLWKALKQWAKESEQPITAGKDHEFDFIVVKTERSTDKDRLRAALLGYGANPADFFVETQSSRFVKRRVKR